MTTEPTGKRAPRRERVEKGIYKRTSADGKTVRFEIGYRDSDSRQRWQVVDGGITAARARLADVKGRIGRGERVAPSPKLTFGEAAEKWYDAQVTTLRPATQAHYKTQLDVHLCTPARWKARRLDSLGVDDVARLVEDLQRAGKKAWTIRSVLVVAGRVFDFAHRRCGWSGENPVRQLDRSERPRSDQRERRVLSGEELERLFRAAEDRYRLAFQFAAGTGARLGETFGLKWRCVDLEAGTAAITHQMDRWGQYVELKTKRSRRTLELPRALVSALRAHKLAAPQGQAGPDDLVFTGPDGGPFDHRNVAGRALARAVKTASLHDLPGLPDPSFHSLRHSFASAWIASGGDLVELSAHLGHSDPAITASVYTHEFEKAARSEARRARLDGMFGMEAFVEATDRDSHAEPAAQNTPTGAEVLALEPRRGVAR